MAADRNGIITGYFVNVTDIENDITIQLFTSSIALIVDSLEPFTVYTVTVAAQTAVGAGPYSIGLSTITTEDGKITTKFCTGICNKIVFFTSSFRELNVLHKQINISNC